MTCAWAGGGGNNGGSPAAQRWRAGRARSARAASMTARGRCSRCWRREVWQQFSSAALAGQPRASAHKRLACQRGAGTGQRQQISRSRRQVYGRRRGKPAASVERKRVAARLSSRPDCQQQAFRPSCSRRNAGTRPPSTQGRPPVGAPTVQRLPAKKQRGRGRGRVWAKSVPDESWPWSRV